MNDPFTILLADDDDIFAMLLRRALAPPPGQTAGHRLMRVNDGSLALAYLKGEPPYDDRQAYPMPKLVLLDQRMIRMDGSTALAHIKADESLARIPVCILSTSDEERLKDTCYRRGASFFIRKAMDYEDMRGRLQLLLRFFQEVLEVA